MINVDNENKRGPLAEGIYATLWNGAISSGLVFVASKIFSFSPMWAVVIGVRYAAGTAIGHIIKGLTEDKLPHYQVNLIHTAAAAVLNVAAIVTLVALGLIGPVGIGILGSLSLLGVLDLLNDSHNLYKRDQANVALDVP